MKRYNSQKAWFKIGPISQAKIGVLALDLAISYLNIALIQQAQEDGGEGAVLSGNLEALQRASGAIITYAGAELADLVNKNCPDLLAQLPILPRGLGRVCHFCGCSEHDACLEPGMTCCSWAATSIPYVRDVCSACDAEGKGRDAGPESIKTQAE